MKSKWSFEITRSGLVPLLIANLVVAYFYFGFLLTDGRLGLSPPHTSILLFVADLFLLVAFASELLANFEDAMGRMNNQRK
jgi:hypothetical protein